MKFNDNCGKGKKPKYIILLQKNLSFSLEMMDTQKKKST